MDRNAKFLANLGKFLQTNIRMDKQYSRRRTSIKFWGKHCQYFWTFINIARKTTKKSCWRRISPFYESIERLGNSKECLEISWLGVLEPPCFASVQKSLFETKASDPRKGTPTTQFATHWTKSHEVPGQKQSKTNWINEINESPLKLWKNLMTWVTYNDISIHT